MRPTSFLYQPIIVIAILFLASDGISQNLVPNPDFEIFTFCPTGFSAGGPLPATPWQSATQGTSDYFHTCATSVDVGVPINFFGTQLPRSGNAYTGMYAWYDEFVYREYLQVRLTEPLVAGTRYEVKYFVSLSENSCAIQNLGVYFSAERPNSGGFGPLPVIPQVEAHLGYIADKLNWTLISGCYFAEGGEQWITIGNFDSDNATSIQPGCEDDPSYYYVEDVSVQLNDTCKLPPSINGTVSTKNGSPIPAVSMQLSENQDFLQAQSYETDQDGFYSFNWLVPDSTYYVKGNKNTGILQGVSTLDLISMQKHLLGRTPFTSLHQYIASDIDHNGHVTIMDAVELRKTILGIYSEFPQNTSWRFGVLPQDFSGSDISTFQETAIIGALEDSVTTIDFRGIKIGDVNESIALNANEVQIEIRDDKAIALLTPDVKTERGAPFTMDVKAPYDLSIEGMQLALNCRDLTLISVEGVAISIPDDHVSFTNDGLLRLSWNQDNEVMVSKNDILFRLTFNSGSGGMVSQKITLAPEILEPEMYLGSPLMTHELKIDFVGPATEAQINSFRIDPNPLRNEAVIRFNLPQDGDVDIHFYDLSGKLIYSIQKQYEAGSHSELIKSEDLSAGGEVICCRLISNGYVSMQKLVLLR